MQIYTYQGLLYCKRCGEDIRNTLTPLDESSENPENAFSYSSFDFPKPYKENPYCFPRHCGSRKDCLDVIKLSSGRKIGAWLRNELTDQGIEFVLREIRSKGERAEIWANFYSFTLSQYMMKKLKNEREGDSYFDKIHIKTLQAENIALRDTLAIVRNEDEVLRLRKTQRHLEAEISRLRRDLTLITLYHFDLLS